MNSLSNQHSKVEKNYRKSMNLMLFLLIGGICILAMYSADSKLMVGATLTLERNRSLISLAKLSLRFSLPIRIRISSVPSSLVYTSTM